MQWVDKPWLLDVCHLHLGPEMGLQEAVQGLRPPGHVWLREHLLSQLEVQPLHLRHCLVACEGEGEGEGEGRGYKC